MPRAIEELGEALRLAQELGQIVLEAQVTSLLIDLGIDAAPPRSTTEDAGWPRSPHRRGSRAQQVSS